MIHVDKTLMHISLPTYFGIANSVSAIMILLLLRLTTIEELSCALNCDKLIYIIDHTPHEH